MNLLKPTKLKIILAIPLLVLGAYGAFSFVIGLGLGMDTNIANLLLSGGLIESFFDLLSVGGILGLFIPSFIPGGISILLTIIFQIFWSYFLSCLLVFLVKSYSKNNCS